MQTEAKKKEEKLTDNNKFRPLPNLNGSPRIVELIEVPLLVHEMTTLDATKGSTGRNILVYYNAQGTVIARQDPGVNIDDIIESNGALKLLNDILEKDIADLKKENDELTENNLNLYLKLQKYEPTPEAGGPLDD